MLHDSPLLKKACVRLVVFDKWFPLNLGRWAQALGPRNFKRPRPDHRAALARVLDKWEVLLRGVGTLRYLFSPNAPVQGEPDGLTIYTKRCGS